MARYRKVDPRMWNDARVRRASNDAKLLWSYLLTAPESTSVPGVIPLFPDVLSARFKWSREHVAELFTELQGMAYMDPDAGLVWLPNAIKHNQPMNEKHLRGWLCWWEEAPECALKSHAWHGIARGLDARYVGTFKALFRPPKTDRNQMKLPGFDTVSDTQVEVANKSALFLSLPPDLNPSRDPTATEHTHTLQDDARAMEQKRRELGAARTGATDWTDGFPVAPPCPRCERPLRLRRNSKTGALWYNHHMDVGMGCEFKCDADELQVVRRIQLEQLKREGKLP